MTRRLLVPTSTQNAGAQNGTLTKSYTFTNSNSPSTSNSLTNSQIATIPHIVTLSQVPNEWTCAHNALTNADKCQNALTLNWSRVPSVLPQMLKKCAPSNASPQLQIRPILLPSPASSSGGGNTEQQWVACNAAQMLVRFPASLAFSSKWVGEPDYTNATVGFFQSDIAPFTSCSLWWAINPLWTTKYVLKIP